MACIFRFTKHRANPDRHWYRFRALALLACLYSGLAFGQTNNASDPDSMSLANRKYLLGDWGGKRSELAEKGVTFDFYYITDLLANPTGGLKQTQEAWNRVRGTMDIDFGKFSSLHGLTFHITGLWQGNGNLGAEIGTIANPSSLVSASTTRLDSWWFQQALFHNKLFLRGGQMGSQDFYGDQLAYGGALLIEPIGYALGNLFSNVYESFDPAGVPTAEVRVYPEKHFYAKGAITAGNRNPYKQDPNGLHFVIANASVIESEAGVLINQDPDNNRKTYPGKYRVGGIYNGGNFTDPVTGIVSSGNHLTYYMAQQAVYRRKVGSDRGLDVFGTYDYSPNDVNKVNSETTAGGRYTGVFASRPKDTLAFGYVLSKVSSHFDEAYFQQGLPLLGSEKAYEVSYLFLVTPWLVVQPDFQHYVDVGANSHIPNATVLGFRTKVTF